MTGRHHTAPPAAHSPGASEPTITHDGPALIMDNPTNDGTVALRLRSSGLGWTSWRLPAGDVEAIRVGLESFHSQPAVRTTSNQH